MIVDLIKQGFQFKHGSVTKHFNTSLVFFVGDTPASGLVGGFKEGVGGANRCCRTCMVTRAELCTKVNHLYMYSILFTCLLIITLSIVNLCPTPSEKFTSAYPLL